jgi:hypothetical protein
VLERISSFFEKLAFVGREEEYAKVAEELLEQ